MPGAAPRAERTDYELVDAGDEGRLERFGSRLIDRPAPTALDDRRAPGDWGAADLRFDDGGWFAGTEPAEPAALAPWQVIVDELTLELRPTASGGLGLYPEHATNLAWLTAQVTSRAAAAGPGAPPAMLNLFAHTGLATLAAARAGAAVAHVDAARAAVAWARHNAELSGLADRPIRWLVDDAPAFVAREARRGRRYDGIVLDPPSYGHARGRRWTIAEDLPALLDACRAIAANDAFVLVTAHTTGLDGGELAEQVRSAFRSRRRVQAEPLELTARSGARLGLGWSIRL